MERLSRNLLSWLLLVPFPALALAENRGLKIENWTAPIRWTVERQRSFALKEGQGPALERGAPFVALTPCRLADTRGNGFTGAFGPPLLKPGGPRVFPVAGQCGVPSDAAAVSLNFTVVRTKGVGYLLAYPEGAARPDTSILNYVAGQIVANNAAVGLGPGGGIAVEAAGQATDLLIDVNGYYGGPAVATLNGLSGDLTLAAGENVTITPSEGTLTVSASSIPGPPGAAGPAGPAGPNGAGGFQSSHDLGEATGTLYMSPVRSGAQSEEHGPVIALVPKACMMTSLLAFVSSPVSPGSAEDFTLRLGTSFVASEVEDVTDLTDTALACTISAGNQFCSAAAAIPVNAGELIDFKVVVTGGLTPVIHEAIVAVVCE